MREDRTTPPAEIPVKDFSTKPSVAMIAPISAQCGVADYTNYLLAELKKLADVRIVTDQFMPEVNNAEIVHIQHQYFLYGGVAPWKNRFKRFLKMLRRPTILTVHEFVEPEGSPLKRAAIRATNRSQFIHPAIRRLVVHTEYDRQRMIRAGIPADLIVIIRHAVPSSPSLPDREASRRELAVEDKFVVTLFGFLSKRKGHLLALEALKELPENVILLFAGGKHPQDTTSYSSELEKEIENLGLSGRVRITGYIPEEKVGTVMSATDLIIAPFTESSGSGSLALGFSCGKPIIASDIPPHKEIVGEEPDVLFLFPNGDAKALSQSIMQVMQDKELLKRLADASSCYAAEHSYARMAEETVALYRAVIGEQR
jgi:glycosyltransferase involved in cell wall biosynthesis